VTDPKNVTENGVEFYIPLESDGKYSFWAVTRNTYGTVSTEVVTPKNSG